MKRYALAASPLASNSEVWMGIDASVKSLAVTLVDAAGQVFHRSAIPATEAAVTAFLARLPGCKVHATYEAGPTGYWLVNVLKRTGCEAFMTPPSMVPVAPGDQVKTDRRDSQKLALLLAGKQLKPVHLHTNRQYAERELVRSRNRAVRARSRVCQQIKSLLLMHDIRIPEGIKANWSRAHLEWLRSVQTGQTCLDLALAELVHRYDDLHASVRRLDKHVAELVEQPHLVERVRLLQSIPGIGILTAVVLLTEMGDGSRFPRSASIGHYAALTPSERSTGESTNRRGHLRSCGNAWIRTALIEAAWTLVYRDAPAERRYRKIAARRGKKIAITAMARWLSKVVFAILRDNRTYAEVTAAAA